MNEKNFVFSLKIPKTFSEIWILFKLKFSSVKNWKIENSIFSLKAAKNMFKIPKNSKKIFFFQF